MKSMIETLDTQEIAYESLQDIKSVAHTPSKVALMKGLPHIKGDPL